MKLIFCIVTAMMLLTPPSTQAMFGHVAAERERRLETQQQLNRQQTVNQRLYIAISVLSAGVVISLVIGTAVGSKARKDHEP